MSKPAPATKPDTKACTACRKVLPYDSEHFHACNQMPFGLRATCKDCMNARMRQARPKYNRKLRTRVLAHYSGGSPRCLCCGETTYEFLVIDHVNGSGIHEHRENPGSMFLYKLQREGFPESYRVLCHNCNYGVSLRGTCPHGNVTGPKAHGVTGRVPGPPVAGLDDSNTQQCFKCERVLPLNENFFYRHPMMGNGFLGKCKECARADVRVTRIALKRRQRIEVVAHYSGGTNACACCGEATFDFLALDHVNGGGCKHHKECNGNVYSWVVQHGFPEGFRVLCFNCNFAIGHYGRCPHALER